MKVFVAGATGVAGRRALRALSAAGHVVRGVARSRDKASLVASLGAEPAEVDLFYPAAVREAVKGYDAIVNLATKIPPPSRALLPGAWKENDRVRVHVSRNLADAALAREVDRYVQESIAFTYPDYGNRWIDEDVLLDVPRYARSILDAEAEAARFTQAGGSGVVLRFGQFYAPDADHTIAMVAAARRGLSPFIGPRNAFMPLVHVDDVAAAAIAALDVSPGTYNVVDDEPLARAELSEIISVAVSRSRLRSVPAPLLRLAGPKVRMLMRSQRVSNRRFRAAGGWEPRFPSAREGLPSVIQAMEAGSS